METLIRVFTQEMPQAYRVRVLNAITTKKMNRGCWDDCILMTAAQAVDPTIRNEGDNHRKVARVLGISRETVCDVIREWAQLNRQQERKFLRLMRVELKMLRRQEAPQRTGWFGRIVHALHAG